MITITLMTMLSFVTYLFEHKFVCLFVVCLFVCLFVCLLDKLNIASISNQNKSILIKFQWFFRSLVVTTKLIIKTTYVLIHVCAFAHTAADSR